MSKLTFGPQTFRILHTGDRHSPQSKLLLGPWVEAYKKVVEIAKEYKVSAVTDAGDSRVLCASSRHADDLEMRFLIRPLAEAGISYFVVDGNHCRAGAAHYEVTTNSWQQHIKDDDLWKGIEYFPVPQRREVFLNPGGKLQVVALPYPPRHAFAATKDIKTKEDLDRAASVFIQKALKDLVGETPENSNLLILFHGTVETPFLKMAGEARMPCGHDVYIPLEAFKGLKNAVVHAGHIHKHQVLSEDPQVFYTGTLVPMEHDSEEIETGVVITEWQPDGKIIREFVPVHTVSYRTVTVEAAAGEEAGIDLKVSEKIKAEVGDPSRTVVRVIVKSASGEVDREAVRKAMAAAGVTDGKLVVDMPEMPAMSELDKKTDDDLGTNYIGNLKAFLAARPDVVKMCQDANVNETELFSQAAAIEAELFSEA